jgi:type I restriction enzyme S subunit
MNWDEIEIGELVNRGEALIKTGPFGTQLKASDYTEIGTPVINVRNLGMGLLKMDQKLEFLPNEMVEKLAPHILLKNDIVFGRKGAVDRHLFVSPEFEGWIQGSDCIRLRINSTIVFPKFVSHFFCTENHKRWMENHCSFGSTMASLNESIVKKIAIPCPPLPIQQKIASILSAYDDLIENNLKRIRLLEEAAQHLYQEWFVRFRFPGWEEAEFGANGVPVGWERKAIGEVCETVGGGTPSTKEPSFWDGGEIVWFSPTDLSKNSSLVLLDSASKITEKGLKNSSAKMLPPRTILMSSRATIGLFGIISKPCSTNQGFISIIPNEEHFRYYFLFNLINRKQEIINNANGSTFKEISKKHFREMEIVIPTSGLIKQFYHLSESFLNQVEYLERQNQKLKEARDILLPRLMDQTIEV